MLVVRVGILTEMPTPTQRSNAVLAKMYVQVAGADVRLDHVVVFQDGAGEGTRTLMCALTRGVLLQLRHPCVWLVAPGGMVAAEGLEPTSNLVMSQAH